MGIEFSRSYKSSDGRCHATLKEAQKHELCAILSQGDGRPLPPDDAAQLIMNHSQGVVDILTTTDKSRPKARAVNGGRKPRKPKFKSALPDYTETLPDSRQLIKQSMSPDTI